MIDDLIQVGDVVDYVYTEPGKNSHEGHDYTEHTTTYEVIVVADGKARLRIRQLWASIITKRYDTLLVGGPDGRDIFVPITELLAEPKKTKARDSGKTAYKGWVIYSPDPAPRPYTISDDESWTNRKASDED